MNNDIVNVNLELIDNSIEVINKEVRDKLKVNNEELKQLLVRLTSEEWISKENIEFTEKLNNYINKLEILTSFYTQVSEDLKKIRLEMENEMNTNPTVHFEG